MLLLRDVFDYPVSETASALGLSEANVKTTHHRARRAMQAYDRDRRRPTRALQEETRAMLGRFMAALATGDVADVEALLADSVRALSDGGGEFHAARVPVVGRAKVARYCVNIARRRSMDGSVAVRMLNGLPTLVMEFQDRARGEGRLVVTRLELDEDSRIAAVHSVLATRKLSALAASRPVC